MQLRSDRRDRRKLEMEGRVQKAWLCMAANTVVTVRCDDVCSDVCDNVGGEFPGLCMEAVLQGISSDTSSEGGISLSVCSVCSETSELRSESSAEFSAHSCDSSRSSQPAGVDDVDSGLFCAKLYRKHHAEAAVWVEKCRKEGKNPLDACGERGDLFFFIQSEWGAFGQCV